MPLALPEPAHICIARASVDHFPLAIRFVVGPGARVGVAVRKSHGAVAGFGAGSEGADVGVAGEGDVGARAVGPPRGLGGGEVRRREVGRDVAGESVGWVVVAAEVLEVGH